MSALESLPEFREWSIPAVHLLRGVVDAGDGRVWQLILSYQSQLESYYACLGLRLVVDESEGFAYVRQMNDEEMGEGYDQLPKLVRRTRLGFDATLLCVLLREELSRFEESDVHNERCVVETHVLFEQWKGFFPGEHDEVRQRRALIAALHKLEELDLIRKFVDEPEGWEIRRILKARLPAAELEDLKARMLAAAQSVATPAQASGSDE